MTIRQIDPTAPTPDAEPMPPTSPDLIIYQTPPPDPSAEVAADDIDDDDVHTDDEPEPEAVEVHADADADDADDEVKPEIDDDVDTHVETEIDDDVDTHVEAESVDGRLGHNGDGQAEPDVERPEYTAIQLAPLEPQDEAEVSNVPAGLALEGRPSLSDGGVFEERWNAIQIGFVDDPRQAVESADLLVTEATADLTRLLASHRESLQACWRPEDNVDTEQLRVVFRSYRGFLLGLLAT